MCRRAQAPCSKHLPVMLRPTTAISQMGKLSLPHEPNVTQQVGRDRDSKAHLGILALPLIPASLSQLLYKVLGPLGPHLAFGPGICLSVPLFPLFLQHLSFKDLGWRREFSETLYNGLAVRGSGAQGCRGPPDYSPNAHLPPAKEKPGHMPGRARPHHPPRHPEILLLKPSQ